MKQTICDVCNKVFEPASVHLDLGKDIKYGVYTLGIVKKNKDDFTGKSADVCMDCVKKALKKFLDEEKDVF